MRDGSPGPPAGVRLLGRQIRHEIDAMLREPMMVFFVVVFPLLFFVIVTTITGNAIIEERSGVRVAQSLLPAMVAFGLVMGGFSNLAIMLTQAREDGVLKRLRGTPLSPAVMIGARVAAGATASLVAVVLLGVVGVLLYDVRIVWRTLPAALLTLVAGVCCFSALGLAVAAVAPTTQAASALTNGIVLPVSFVSDIFTVGESKLPAWMDAIGWFFPLRHVAHALVDASDPSGSGPGLYPGHLAVIVVWGLVGAAVAVRRLGPEPGGRSPGRRNHHRAGRGSDALPRRRAGRPSVPVLLLHEVRHSNAALWRDPASAFFTVAFPALLVLLIPELYGRHVLLPDGTPLPRFYAPTMAIYGAAVTTYITMPEGLVRARERGVLERLVGTPLPIGLLLIGRVLSSMWISFVTFVTVMVLAGVVFGVPVPPDWPVAVAAVLAASGCYAVFGLVLVSFLSSSRAVTAAALGTLLPLSFVCEVFVVGLDLPPLLDTIGWLTPLRHAALAASEAYSVGGIGLVHALGHLGVLLAWTLPSIAVVVWRVRVGDLTRRPR